MERTIGAYLQQEIMNRPLAGSEREKLFSFQFLQESSISHTGTLQYDIQSHRCHLQEEVNMGSTAQNSLILESYHLREQVQRPEFFCSNSGGRRDLTILSPCYHNLWATSLRNNKANS